jgi:hypothetical protein
LRSEEISDSLYDCSLRSFVGEFCSRPLISEASTWNSYRNIVLGLAIGHEFLLRVCRSTIARVQRARNMVRQQLNQTDLAFAKAI